MYRFGGCHPELFEGYGLIITLCQLFFEIR